MSKSKRIECFVIGLLIIIAALLLLISKESACIIICAAFALIFTVLGVRNIVYYCSLARFMTGGMMALFRGFIFIDLGLFGFSILNMEKTNVMLFIMLGFIAAGVIDIIKALELKKISSPVWKINLVEGIICTILPMFSSILAFAVLVRGLITLISAFRKTAIVYINE